MFLRTVGAKKHKDKQKIFSKSTMTEILNKQQTKQKIRRIAYQIYENNFEETELIFAAIYPNGVSFATLLLEELRQIVDIQVQFLTIQQNQDTHYVIQGEATMLKDKTIILIDAVLHTGKTLIYSLKPLLDIPVKKIQTAVLIKREHRIFPVHADYVGYALSTTIKQHIHVELSEEEKFGVYLF